MLVKLTIKSRTTSGLDRNVSNPANIQQTGTFPIKTENNTLLDLDSSQQTVKMNLKEHLAFKKKQNVLPLPNPQRNDSNWEY